MDLDSPLEPGMVICRWSLTESPTTAKTARPCTLACLSLSRALVDLTDGQCNQVDKKQCKSLIFLYKSSPKVDRLRNCGIAPNYFDMPTLLRSFRVIMWGFVAFTGKFTQSSLSI